MKWHRVQGNAEFYGIFKSMKVKWMLARHRRASNDTACRTESRAHAGRPVASLGSLMTVTGQLSNRKGSNQICNSVEDESDPERLEKGRPTRRRM